MKIGVPKETAPGEARVALTPEGVKELVAKQLSVVVQTGAGAGAFYTDADYEAAGAEIVPDAYAADLIVQVNGPSDASLQALPYRSGSVLVSFLFPSTNPQAVEALNKGTVTSFAMDLMPRITRAQSMDALSSMSTVAGYKAALLAAETLPKFFPMLMTASGTIPPARVLVIGAGVAGLQAIATSRRLGAIVEAFDVRPAVKEQIESLGAKFIGLSLLSEEAEDAGGYAKEVSGDTHTKELDLIASRLPNIDCVITTALIPGKKAPVLITRDMLAKMRAGSVIVDLAAPNGGNCEATIPGQTVVDENVTVIGRTDLLASMAHDASRMYSKNIATFLGSIIAEGALKIDLDDEVVKGTLVTHEGKTVHEVVRIANERGNGQ